MDAEQEKWINNLLEQYPEYADVINKAAREAAGLSSPTFGDHVLGSMAEAGADV